MTGWQPIETAPDEDILLLCKGQPCIGIWTEPGRYWQYGGWIDGNGYGPTPTHWQPLSEIGDP